MTRREWALLAAGLGYACWGCWSAIRDFSESSLPAHRPAPGFSAPAAPSPDAESTRWESDNRFSRFYSARGAAAAREGLGDLRDSPSDYRSRESSLAALAKSLDPEAVRIALREAERSGAAPEVVAHYRYLKDIVDAFLEGRLHELVEKARSAEPGGQD